MSNAQTAALVAALITAIVSYAVGMLVATNDYRVCQETYNVYVCEYVPAVQDE